MAADKKASKRKAAAAADAPAKKTKKVDPKPSEPANDAPKPALKKKKGDAAVDKSAKSKDNGEPTRQIKPRKRAADFLSDDEDSEADGGADAEMKAPQEKPSKKKSKKEDGAAPKDQKPKPAGDKKPKSISKPSKAETKAGDSDDDAASAASASDEDGEDDQTTALIKGFESSGDEDASGDEGFDASKPLPKVPDSKKAKRKIQKKQKESGEPEEPGTVYIGRIPHGFYEHQMRAYFSQFGEITRLRLSRNRITGRSKHYAFVEFSSVSVAKIVAATMDNYLMYGHILKCKYVPSEQLHPEIWKGANRRFKMTPWNKLEKKRLESGKTREQWADRIEKEQKKRQAKAKKLQELGYEMELPQLKSVDEVPVREEPAETEGKAVEAKPDEPAKAIEAPKETETKTDDTPKEQKEQKEQKESKKAKKSKKGGQVAEEAPKQDEPEPKEVKEPALSTGDKKAKKAKKGGQPAEEAPKQNESEPKKAKEPAPSAGDKKAKKADKKKGKQ